MIKFIKFKVKQLQTMLYLYIYMIVFVANSRREPIIYTKYFDSDREFDLRKTNDVGNDIFRTQQCKQFLVGKNGLY